MTDSELQERFRRVYNLIHDTVVLTQELDSAVRLLMERDPETLTIYEKQLDEARKELTERRGVPPLNAEKFCSLSSRDRWSGRE